MNPDAREMALVTMRSRQNVSEFSIGSAKKQTNAIAARVRITDALIADFKLLIMPVF